MKTQERSPKTARGNAGKCRSGGFTMIELLIAVFLATIVTSAAMAIYITQHKQLIVQDQVTDMQSSIRAAAAELTTKIRMAGFQVPLGVPAIISYDTNPDTIIVLYDSNSLRGVQIEWPMPQPSAELRCDGHDLTGLYDGDWVFIYDPILRSGEFFEVTHVQYSSFHIQHNTMPLNHAYPKGSKVIKMNRFKFFVDQSDANHPNLMVQVPGQAAQVFAENITDLQFRYLLSSGAIVNVPILPDMIREVMIDVDARSDKADQDFQAQYRTRALSTRVKVRNLGVN